jgi:hypothetical protein
VGDRDDAQAGVTEDPEHVKANGVAESTSKDEELVFHDRSSGIERFSPAEDFADPCSCVGSTISARPRRGSPPLGRASGPAGGQMADRGAAWLAAVVLFTKKTGMGRPMKSHPTHRTPP